MEKEHANIANQDKTPEKPVVDLRQIKMAHKPISTRQHLLETLALGLIAVTFYIPVISGSWTLAVVLLIPIAIVCGLVLGSQDRDFYT